MEAKDTVLKIEDWKQFDLEAHKRANQLAQDTEGSFNSADIEAIYEAAEIAKLERQAEISFKAGIKEVMEWLQEYAIHGGEIPLKSVLEDIETHSPFMMSQAKRMGDYTRRR